VLGWLDLFFFLSFFGLEEKLMVERRLTRTDQAGLPQPDRVSLLASASGARDLHAAL